jgi:hypothetical protein
VQTQAATVPLGHIDIDFAAASLTMDGATFGFQPLGVVPQEIVVAGGAEAVVKARLEV